MMIVQRYTLCVLAWICAVVGAAPHSSLPGLVPRSSLNRTRSDFVVNGSALPEVDFDVGESYAGLLPISSNANDSRQLYFWYFPSSNPKASDEITIWLNGGPGDSSLEGLLQENGPFIWQFGTWRPVPVSKRTGTY